jgi:hypothetical protein
MPQGHKAPDRLAPTRAKTGCAPEQYDLREAAHADGARAPRAESGSSARTGTAVLSLTTARTIKRIGARLST